MTFTLWFMGRPAAGKSTLAKRVESHLREQEIPVKNLDGDEIRKNLHPDLGFTREDRATNNRRTAFIARLLNRNDTATVVGMITPFRKSQQQAREIIEPDGRFVLIQVKCSVNEAANRDPKNLYEEAEAGNIENFTGINHPFQEPHNPDIVVDTEAATVKDNVSHILDALYEMGLFESESDSEYVNVNRAEKDEIESRLASLGYIAEDEE